MTRRQEDPQQSIISTQSRRPQEDEAFIPGFGVVVLVVPSFLSSQTPAGRGRWPPSPKLVLPGVSSCEKPHHSRPSET
ncbi:uncharacterized protein PAE49_009464 isoform 2-T2 [Odontesthes bonariensis]